MKDFKISDIENQDRLAKMVGLAESYTKRVQEENTLSKDELKTRYVGKLDPKKHLEDLGKLTIEENIVNTLMGMVDKEASFSVNTDRVQEEEEEMEVDDIE